MRNEAVCEMRSSSFAAFRSLSCSGTHFARCGLHALNNALGFAFLTAQDMTYACDVLLQEREWDGSPERREDHECAAGWYSEAVMTQALRCKRNIYKMDVDAPLKPEEEENLERIYESDVIGVVVNVNQVHWVAFKVDEQRQIWSLDSTEFPTRKTFKAFMEYVKEYTNAFLIRHI